MPEISVLEPVKSTVDRRSFLALLVPSAAAVAQENAAVPAPAPTLSALLKTTRWTPSTAKTLLIFGGKQLNPFPYAESEYPESIYLNDYTKQYRELTNQLGPPPKEGYALAAVAAGFGRRVTRFGQVSTLALTRRRMLNLSPGPPLFDPDEHGGPLMALIHALDDAGIKKLLSESGLGRGDLPTRLQPLFDGIQPGPLWLTRINALKSSPPFLALPQERLSSLRLRVSLVSSLVAERGEDSQGYLIYEGRALPPEEIPLPSGLRRASAPGTIRQPKPVTVRGRMLTRTIEGIPPASDLDTALLNRRISLEGITTLGKLAERVSEAEGLSLVVPPALRAWSIEWRGSPEVRTGDVIRAIIASTMGAFRECLGSYVLTDDLAPLGPRLDKLAQWIHLEVPDGNTHKREFLPLEWGRFEAGDACPLPMAWRERLADANPFEGITLRLSEFPDQKLLERLMAPYYASKPDFAPTHLNLALKWMAYLVVPDTGVVPLDPVYLFGRKRKPERRALTLRDTWPILRVADASEAKQALGWAKQQGATGIVIDGPPEIVQAAIAERTLPVRALHRLWRAQLGDFDTLKERTIENRVTSWLSPTNPEAQAIALERLKRYATLPGLDGLLLRDATPPGYRGYGNDHDGATLTGYTERNRKAFLSQHHRDIFDLGPATNYFALHTYTPWLNSNDEDIWRSWRMARLNEALNQLRKAVPCPAWLEGGFWQDKETQERLGSPLPGWLVRWTDRKAEDDTVLWQSAYNASQKLIGNARECGQAPWLLIPITPGNKRSELEERLSALEFESGSGWQGRYIDLSELSLTEAQALLSPG